MGFNNTNKVIVVGGAGFVGSNLVRMLLRKDVEKIVIIDNLLLSEKENIPEDSRIDFWYDTITNDDVLNKIADEYDYIFHLATYHGNQSAIHDPLADHENNTLTTLKLMNHIRESKKLLNGPKKIYRLLINASINMRKTWKDAGKN